MNDDKVTLNGLFDGFYRAINGFAPYGWQRRLVRYVAEKGKWPELLDGPTGSGKTAVLEVHVFLNAFAGQLGIPKDIPRRLVIAVNRRSLVDSQYLHAQAMSELLHRALSPEGNRDGCPQGILAQVAAGLTSRWGESGKNATQTISPLMVTSMRGGSDVPNRDNAWRLYPEAPMLICATPDMVGSRLLFRGYGTSRMMRSVEAGLLACDSVLVIDEAHGNRQLSLTARRISALEKAAGIYGRAQTATGENIARLGAAEPGGPDRMVARPLQVVESTATPADDSVQQWGYDRIGVSDQDVEFDKSLADRVSKPKLLQIHSTNGGTAHVNQMVDLALESLETLGGVVAVIVNTVKTAVAVEEKLRTEISAFEDEADALDIVCVLGRMRAFDRTDAVQRLREMGAPGKRGVIIGTQALEVGLNYDCRTMVTELCPASALVQRFGRVNRFGRFPNGLAIVVDGHAGSRGPYEQSDLDTARSWVCGLRDLHPDGVSAFDLARIEVPSQTGKRTLYQRLEISDIDYLSHTSEHLGAEEGVQTIDGSSADLALWLRDELGSGEDRDVSLVVRSGLPGNPIEACDLVSRVPPLEEELFPCSYSEMRGVMDACLRGREDRLGAFQAEVSGLDSFGRAFTLLGSEDGQHFYPVDPSDRLIPGGVYIVDASAPVFRGPVVAPRGNDGKLGNAVDVYNQIALRKGVSDIPFVLDDSTRSMICAGDTSCADELRNWESELKQTLVEIANDLEDEETQTEVMARFSEEAARRLPEGSAALQVAQNLEAVLAVHERDLRIEDVMLVYRPAINSSDVSQLEIGGSREVLLDEHGIAVSDLARRIARSVGLPAIYEEAVAIAGAHHDDGKVDPRFQRMLAGGKKPACVLAKSKERSRSDVIRLYKTLGISGWRHEQLSAVMVWDSLRSGAALETDEQESAFAELLPIDICRLIVRLVGTSHGRGRAVFDRGVSDLCADEELNCRFGSAMDELFGLGLWENLVSRTDKLFGYWGVAYLEAVVRAADARESATEQGGDC